MIKQPKKNDPLTANTIFSTGSLMGKGFFLFFYTVPVAYGISARSLDDYITYGLTIAGILFNLNVTWLYGTRLRIAMQRGQGLQPIPRKYHLIFYAGNAAVSLLIGVLFYSAGVAIVDLYDWVLRLNPMQNRYQFNGLAGAAILAFGVMFFWIRLKLRFTYGLVEASMGVVFAVHRLSTEQQVGLPTDTGFYLAMLTAGIYLVVRGLDNMHHGWKEAKDPLAKVLVWLGTSPIYKKPPRRLRPGNVSPKDTKHKARRSKFVESRTK